MKKRWIASIFAVTAAIVGILYYSMWNLAELNDSGNSIGEDVAYMDMSDFADSSVSYITNKDSGGIYDQGAPLSRENIDLDSCRLSSEGQTEKYIDILRSLAGTDGISGLEPLIAWDRVSDADHEMVSDAAGRLCDLLCSDRDIFITQETKVGDALIVRLCGVQVISEVKLGQLYDYAHAEYLLITIIPIEKGSFSFVPYNII